MTQRWWRLLIALILFPLLFALAVRIPGWVSDDPPLPTYGYTSEPMDPKDGVYQHLSAFLKTPVKLELGDCKFGYLQKWESSCLPALQQGQALLKQFDAYSEDPSSIELQYLPSVGLAPRFPIQDLYGENLIPIRQLVKLGRLIHLRSIYRLSTNDRKGAADDAKLLWRLGTFVGQNPTSLLQFNTSAILLKLYVASFLMLHEKGEHLKGIDSEIPSAASVRRAWTIAIENEWRASNKFVQEFFTGVKVFQGEQKCEVDFILCNLRLSAYLGLFQETDTIRTMAKYYSGLRKAVEMEIPLTSLQEQWSRNPWTEQSFMKYFNNPVGRRFTWARMGTEQIVKVGHYLDQVSAYSLVLASDSFQRATGRVVKDEADLVPQFVRSWPLSSLTGERLKFIKAKGLVVIPPLPGHSECSVFEEPCEFSLR